MSSNEVADVESGGPSKNGIDLQIGSRIRELREGAGLTVQQLATQIDTGFDSLVAMEAGALRVPARVLFAIAGNLDVRIAAFFDRD